MADLEIGGKQIYEWNEVYYMIFEWVEGASIFSSHDYPGELFCKIHSKNLAIDGAASEEGGTTMIIRERHG